MSPDHTPPGRILVAEDDDALRSLLVEALREQGHTVHEVAGAGALRAAAVGTGGGSFDLVISDIHMGDGDGLAVLEALRREGHAIPMILMTAFGNEATRHQVERLGGLLLSKPFELRQLAEAAARLLARGHAAAHRSEL